jgi:uncharacterized protein (DUF1501 family)
MNRKQFVKNVTGGVLLPSILGGWSVRAFAENPLPDGLGQLNLSNTDHILVLIQLGGGNDGLNTLVPLDQYAALAAARPQVVLPQSAILSLNGQATVGLHPAMSAFRNLYNDGKAMAVQAVSYPDPVLSHFRSTDIIMSASASDTVVTSGWIGRYLAQEYPNYPSGFPNTNTPDPLAVEIGDSASLTQQGPLLPMGMVIGDPDSFYSWVSGTQTAPPNTFAGAKLQYIRTISSLSRAYGAAVTAAYDNGTTAATANYPTNSKLAARLKGVAKMISGGSNTRIYIVTQTGYDTHSAQVETSNHSIGKHADLLTDLSESIAAFMRDINAQGFGDRVLGMTASEFGRRVIANASGGTDHGVGAPMFLFGNKVQSGILGANPIISPQADWDDNVPMQYDFRSVYTSVLRQWFCLSEAETDNVMLGNFAMLPIVQQSAQCMPVSVHETNQNAGKLLLSIYPNPVQTYTTISFEVLDAQLPSLLQIFATNGQLVHTLCDKPLPVAPQTIEWNAADLPKGVYYVRFQNGAAQQVKSVAVVR